jgi:hypothetical protein
MSDQYLDKMTEAIEGLKDLVAAAIETRRCYAAFEEKYRAMEQEASKQRINLYIGEKCPAEGREGMYLLTVRQERRLNQLAGSLEDFTGFIEATCRRYMPEE